MKKNLNEIETKKWIKKKENRKQETHEKTNGKINEIESKKRMGEKIKKMEKI